MNLLKKILFTRPGLLPLSGLFLLVPASLYAAPVTWTIQGITFSDGGTASGSFVFNATTDAFSSIDIITTAGTDLTGATYAFLDPSRITFDGPTELSVVTSNAADLSGTTILLMTWDGSLTDAQGLVGFPGFFSSGEGVCISVDCSAVDPNYRVITSGLIASATAPEPSTFVLLGCALGALGLRRRSAENGSGECK